MSQTPGNTQAAKSPGPLAYLLGGLLTLALVALTTITLLYQGAIHQLALVRDNETAARARADRATASG